jgi:hypothetical protein
VPNFRPLVLSENDGELNRAALVWINQANEHAPPHHLHLLSLAAWGLDEGVSGDWPDKNRYALQEQVNLLFGWKPANVITWLISNPNGPEDTREQEEELLSGIETADSPEFAAAMVLNAIYSRQVASCPALRAANTIGGD